MHTVNRIPLLLIFLLNSVTLKGYADTAPPQSTLAPGYSALPFVAPAPGSYHLPGLGLAADGKVVDSNNKDLALYDLVGDKVVLLSFIYSTCSDVNGCPLATMVLQQIKTRLKKEPSLANDLRLITLSFNPEHDTPEIMRDYAQELQGSGVEWQFLTTRSERELAPILEHYPQNTQKAYDANGQFTGTFSHNLRVYLIDKNKQLRNIYSVSFLHPDTLINDVKTLLAKTQHPSSLVSTDKANTLLNHANLYAAGDNKEHYEQQTYKTQSIALTARKGQAIDLFAGTQQPLLGLPSLPVPDNNALSAAKISLGRKLFYDRRLSFNNTFSCALCHIPEQGFTSNELATSVGVEGRSVRRNAPTLYNVAYAQQLFHDGRETTLEQQVWGPLLAHNEMANPSIGHVIEKIQQHADYNGLFEAAFNHPASMETVGMALASYQRTLNAADAPFDRWHYGKAADSISPAAQRGYALFTGKAGCSNCHTISEQEALFTDQQLHNTGIGYAQSMAKTPETNSVQIAPGVFTTITTAALQSVAETKASDLGQYEITQNPAHRWRYKTPTLRNISLTAPYMHNGSLAQLRDVVVFYNQGGVVNENLDPLIKPLHLQPQEIDDVVAFLQTLTGSNVSSLVADAFAAPIGDME
ncbi:MAG: SCO family protein [Methylococcales bacterium]|nr:SCO family protein [Methylococcales bacterium]